MKIIAFYLPQFHSIPENDAWWGKGFTEWENMKSARSFFEGHYQPRIPQNGNYYNLLDDNVKKWQIELAKENGVYGFCFYHYWFNGHLLLEKPIEQFLYNKDLKMPFCLCWANEPWTKAWVSKDDEILIDQEYGSYAEWENHFNYLLQYFKDSRYITNNGKPLLVIYRPNQIENLNQMLDYWQELSKRNGLTGIEFAYQQIDFDLQKNSDTSRFSYNIEFQPIYALEDINNNVQKITRILKKIDCFLKYILKVNLSNVFIKQVRKYDYDKVWQAVLNHTPNDYRCIPGAFIDWDNTPRRKEKGRVFIGGSPEKFKKYLVEQLKRTKEIYNKDMIFLTAWNEWSEGCYLEPDEKYGTGYLNAIKEALNETNEFPVYPE